MVVLTPEQMHKLDQTTIDRGFPEILLMEAAGRQAAEIIEDRARKEQIKDRVLVFCGTGNNGGDGLVIARFLDMWGFDVRVVISGSSDDFSQVSAKNYELCQQRGIQIREFSALNISKTEVLIKKSSIIVDALLGTGISGSVRGSVSEIIGLINKHKEETALTAAVDIPSGISGRNGQILGRAVKADLTMVMAFLKTGLCLYPGRQFAGKIVVVDIGIPSAVSSRFIEKKCSVNYYSLEGEEAARMLPRRPQTGHKGTFGRVAVLGGSPGMTGAPFLSGISALKTGAGLVKVLVPGEIQNIVASYSPELMVAGLSGENGQFASGSISDIKPQQEQFDVIAAGPGMGRGQGVKDFVGGLLDNAAAVDNNIPLLLDADALNEISSPDQLQEVENPLILTPHPGEMARLVDKEVSVIEGKRLYYTRKFARENGVFLVLKGAATTIGLPGGKVHINRSGNQGLATAGSGDVLTGIIAGLLAQGLDPAEAVVLGPYIHGRAGDLALPEKTAPGLTARDIVNFIPAVYRELKEFLK